MAKVLLTWELGGGSGHFVNLRPFVYGLEAAGHKVFVALRDPRRAAECWEARRCPTSNRPINRTCRGTLSKLRRTFAHILHNVGFGDPAELAVMVDAWRGLIDSLLRS